MKTSKPARGADLQNALYEWNKTNAPTLTSFMSLMYRLFKEPTPTPAVQEFMTANDLDLDSFFVGGLSAIYQCGYNHGTSDAEALEMEEPINHLTPEESALDERAHGVRIGNA